jgi:hypothetical protein
MQMAGFNPSVMTNRDTFSRFIYRLHNCINDMLGKKIKIPYEEVRDRYEHFRARCNEKEKKSEILLQQLYEKKEKGCSDSLYGTKSKSIIRVVPKSSKIENFKINPKCKTKSIN